MGSVVVLGSANVDVVYAVERIPGPGETVLASGQARHPGGKGLNQAVASARAGAETTFIGAVGDDDAAGLLVEAMTDAGLELGLLRAVEGPTGSALISVDALGENAIVVASGANASLVRLAADEQAAIEAASVLVMQLETPLVIVTEAARAARESGTRVILNAAPAQPLDRAVLDVVDVLVVNEHEARLVAGGPAGASGGPSLDDVGAALAEQVAVVVVTLGERGARWFGREGESAVVAPPANVVDSTGAGDTFTGVLAAALAEGVGWSAAVERAVVAGAIAVESAGAVPSIPTRTQVDARLNA